ncbi:uncharacterized protein TNCV_4000551 [Trichonephila clavipes]|nr:uncharacterized protein TNCV_4000551 [Trichonephila clavipes]
MRTCRPFPRLPRTGGQERQRSLYPSDVDCHWQAQIIQFGDQGLHRADSHPLDSLGSDTVFSYLYKHSNDPMCCPECLEPMTLGHFYYKHAPKTHALDSRKQCIFCFGRRQWNREEKNLSVNVNHIVSCLKLFVTNEKDFSAIVEAKEENIAEEIEVETCKCQHFQSNPRDMAGRRKLNIVGFYDSMFEKPEIWEEGIEFHGGLGKDVWGIVERYLRGDLEWFHIMVKHDIFEIFCREMEKTRNQCVILPFWCLCDGLVNEKVTKFPPAYLLFGTLPYTPPLAQNQVYPLVEEARKLAKENTIKYHEKNKIKYDARFIDSPFEPGDLVIYEEFNYPNRRKLSPIFSGPYEIVQKLSDVNYEITKPNALTKKLTEIVHVSKLRTYYPPEELKLSHE